MDHNRLNCILIIDDDPASNYITEHVLRSLGIAVIISTVSDGYKGIDFIRHQCTGEDTFTCPDLIILDINMPRMSGVEFLEKYHALKKDRESTIITLSALELPLKAKEKLIKMGVSHFLLKPLSAEELRQVAEEIFSDQEKRL